MLFSHTIHIYLRQYVSFLYVLYYMCTCKYIGICTRISRKNTLSFSLSLKIRPHTHKSDLTVSIPALLLILTRWWCNALVSCRRVRRHCPDRNSLRPWRRCWSRTVPHARRALRGTMGGWRGGAWVEWHSIFPSVAQVNERQADRHLHRH